MTGFIFFGVALLISAAAGWLVHKINPNLGNHQEGVTRTEWVAGVLASVLVIWLVTLGGSALAKGDAVTFNEYWSGLEKEALAKTIQCQKDGSCRHTYDCDSYVVMVTKTRQVPYTTTETYTDANGKVGTRTVTKYRTETYQEPETRYHSCPYVTEETTYTVKDTMGESYTIGAGWFPESPEDHRWTGSGYNEPRFGFGKPDLPNVGSGIPKKWAEAKARIDAGTPGGTTKREKYKNYVLASSSDIYEKYSDAIAEYKKAKVLPKPTAAIRDLYYADKVYFTGGTPSDSAEWQQALQTLNGYLGDEHQGDLHVVVVDPAKVTDPERYTAALEAYWQSEELGRDAFSKNGVAVVLGVSSTSSTVEWARAFTGMPMGNEALIQAIKGIEGQEATAENVLAYDGIIGQILFSDEVGFTRVEMKNYEYLYDSIQIGMGARVLILIAGLFLSMLVWGIMLMVNLKWTPLENLSFRKGDTKGSYEYPSY